MSGFLSCEQEQRKGGWSVFFACFALLCFFFLRSLLWRGWREGIWDGVAAFRCFPVFSAGWILTGFLSVGLYGYWAWFGLNGLGVLQDKGGRPPWSGLSGWMGRACGILCGLQRDLVVLLALLAVN